MRLEDKELEGPELEREQRLQVVEERPREGELPILAGEEVRDLELVHRGRLFDAMQAILAGSELGIGNLHLPRRASEALEFLQTAVVGKDTRGVFVYAEDRASMLEQALAVLQANITHGDSEQVAQLAAKYGEMAGQVAALREELSILAEAQEDAYAHELQKGEEEEEAATPGPEDGAAAATDVEPITDYLRAPALPERPAHASTLTEGGPEAPPLPVHVSTLGE